MKIDISFSGLDEHMKKMQESADPVSRQIAEEKALKRIGKRTKNVMFGHIPVSKDNSKSGRGLKNGRSSRPKHGHARDNIPVTKVYRRRDGSLNIDVGWLLGDNSEYFYMKFVEWGTSKKAPHDFLYNTLDEAEPELREMVLEEYNELLKALGVT